ncbi:iron-containing alcohol dehydrogenase [Olsenella sp. AGMB03486]|jgi:alcohol dehydrogenase class IV|uniref:iron-containing alcohol dehydrogenase n=1 Tax=Olsenella sp. AGMB03486 TaxID=3230364 RepID=UPI002A89B7D4|nr:iron-containing alcohol dehydrogenase [Olsenella sp.]MDY4652519.1 iron-containing alcohol dehydrogenase [Atopobiaceae bacterium]MDY5275869.1 iron-containing alcohol dehydrogenase [Atopobiaceae bacterium]
MIKNYALKLPQVVYGGEDATEQLVSVIEKAGAKNVAVFTDPSLRKLGLVDPALAAIKEAGAEAHIFDNIPAEPSYIQVQEVVDEVTGTGTELVVAVGGGSVMDTAKLACVCAGAPYTVHDLLKDPARARKQLPCVAVPTTAGTGAEATINAIVAVPEDEVKIGIVNDAMMPDVVLLDVRMVQNLPRSIAAATGVDAMCHAIECFTCKKANPFSDTFALEAFDLIINNIEHACDSKDDLEAKRAMQIAALYGGIAITASGTTAVHGLSYPLGGKYHVPHGVSNAILLSPVMHFNEPAIRDRLAAAYDHAIKGDAKTEEEKSAAVIKRMDEIVEHLDIPKTLDALGVHDAPIDWLAEAGIQQQRLLSNNKREVTLEDAKAIYRQIM